MQAAAKSRSTQCCKVNSIECFLRLVRKTAGIILQRSVEEEGLPVLPVLLLTWCAECSQLVALLGHLTLLQL